MLPKGRHMTPLNGRGYGHVTVLKILPCRDAARRAGSSAAAELLVNDPVLGIIVLLFII